MSESFTEELRRRAREQQKAKAATSPPPPVAGDGDMPVFPPLRPLPQFKLEPVLPYREDMLPAILRPWLVDVAERGQFHFDYLAASSMAALGSVVARRCAVYPKQKDDWAGFSNLWCVIVGRPGAMKSPTLSAILSPLRFIEARSEEEYKKTLKEFNATAVRAEIEHKAAKHAAQKAANSGENFVTPEAPELTPPRRCRLLTSDSTEAKLGDLLAENPNGLTLELDELTAINAAFEREPGLREFLLKAWGGKDPHTVDRIGRGTTLIPHPCLSVIGGIQPGRIAQIVNAASQGNGGDGFLQRFQRVAWPDGWKDEWKNVDRWPDDQARKAVNERFSQLARMVPSDFPDVSNFGPRGLRFTPEAQEIFNDWHAQLQQMLRSGILSEVLESSLAKSVKLVAGVSLLCELAENPLAAAISAKSLSCALEWKSVSESHIRRLYACSAIAETTTAQLIWAKIKEGKLTEGFTAREIKQSGWKGLGDEHSIDEALASLAECGWIKGERVNTNSRGRPSFRYVINPEALE